MDDQVSEVKRRTDIVAVIRPRVELKRAGKYWKGLCPFHAEKTPSFFVSEELQIYKCFGCGASGDCFSFLQAYEGLSFREALEELAAKVGVKLQVYRPSGNEVEVKRLYEVLSLAREYYAYILDNHPAGREARNYLARRGINRAVYKKFELGWAPESWDGLIKYLVGKKRYKPEELEKAGMAIGRTKIKGSKLRASDYYDRFRGRVMFPLTDFRGRVVGFSGRLIDEREKEAKYINTPETVLYHKRELLYGISLARGAIRKKDRVLVVEGEMDVIASFRAGVANVVGIKGSALTEEQLRLINRLTRNVALCLDADAAGDEATKRGIEIADRLGMDVEVVEIEGGKDPDEVVARDPELWKKQVSQGVSIYDYFIAAATRKYDLKTGVGKKRISEELAPILVGISNKVEQAHYVKKLAQCLGVDEEVVEVEMEKSSGRVRLGVKDEEKEPQKEKFSREQVLERYIWGLLLRYGGEELKKAVELIGDLEWVNPGLKSLLGKLKEYLDKNKGKFALEQFVAGLPEELEGLVRNIYFDEEMIRTEESDKSWVGFAKAVGEYRKLVVKAKMKKMAEEIEKLERVKESGEELERLKREFSRLMVEFGSL